MNPYAEYSDNFFASSWNIALSVKCHSFGCCCHTRLIALAAQNDKCIGNTNKMTLEWQRRDLAIAKRVSDKISRITDDY